jgi:hypothetical protein
MQLRSKVFEIIKKKYFYSCQQWSLELSNLNEN